MSVGLYGQVPDGSREKCPNTFLGTTFLAKPYKGKETLIKETWCDYFGVDLEKELPWKGKNPVVSIKLDAHGCVYPPFAGLIDKDDFLDEQTHFTQFYKFSFYRLFADTAAANKIFRKMESNGYDGQLISSVRKIASKALLHDVTEEELVDREYNFRKEWNSLFLPAKIREIDSVVAAGGAQGVFFFIAGFNVPYSLQHIQGNYLFRKIEDSGPGKAVFVRLIWPSESAKKITFGERSKYRDRFQLSTVRKNLYVANRSYLAGLTLREILKKIEAKNINMLSHSHGAVVVTSSLMDPGTKMSTRRKNSALNKRMLAEFDALKPKQGIRVRAFLSAPGIPGKSTFVAMDPIAGAGYKFFVGYNNRDKILLKRQLLLPVPRRFSSTTLGCNWSNEINDTMAVFKLKNLEKNIIPVAIGNQRTHDIFCYTMKDGFNSLFNQFLESCYNEGQ
jgi:hypothetical protein